MSAKSGDEIGRLPFALFRRLVLVLFILEII
ncbi:hypothetical protein BLAT2472_20540 [Burkholderia latens]